MKPMDTQQLQLGCLRPVFVATGIIAIVMFGAVALAASLGAI